MPSKASARCTAERTRARDYTQLPWTLWHVLGIVAMWKKYSDTIMVNCIDRLIQSVENHAGGKKSQNYLDFISVFLGSLES